MAGHGRCSGFSLPELLVTVGVIAVMATIAVMSITGVDRDAASVVATRNLNLLNGAVNAFKNAQWELVLSPSPGTTDEQSIFFSLQHRDATDPVPGSPFLTPTLAFATTSSDEAYRAVWNGRYFQLVEPGTPGEGVDLGGLTASVGSGPPPGFTPVPPP